MFSAFFCKQKKKSIRMQRKKNRSSKNINKISKKFSWRQQLFESRRVRCTRGHLLNSYVESLIAMTFCLVQLIMILQETPIGEVYLALLIKHDHLFIFININWASEINSKHYHLRYNLRLPALRWPWPRFEAVSRFFAYSNSRANKKKFITNVIYYRSYVFLIGHRFDGFSEVGRVESIRSEASA